MDVVSFLKTSQLDLMLFMGGICAALAGLTTFTGGMSSRRRCILATLELSAMLLLVCDRFAYLYRGDVSTLGFWMVRVCNFMVFLCTLTIPFAVTLYVEDLYREEGTLTEMPRRLRVCYALYVAGVALIVISQFTGLYYTFDAANRYERSPGYVIGFAMPFVIIFLTLSVIWQYRRLLSRSVMWALVLFSVIPALAAIVQLFIYGISITNIAMVGMAIYLYSHALRHLSDSLAHARAREIGAYKEAQRREHVMFEQTAWALANAIDAKDAYTHGHSSRVAGYSEMIAHEVGYTHDECERVYFTALLHDVGKIGVNDAIITKAGRLTDEEFAEIKRHPTYGAQILESISESPYLAIGAHYHHERYDGRGYPEGLAGEDIPEMARIIAVADAYDAMTSQRSYRDVRPQHLVREELVKGMGTQFDPRFARIMLHYMDLDQEYHMHQQLEGMTADLVEGLNTQLEPELRCEEVYHACTTGVRILEQATRISFVCEPDEGAEEALPTVILFDSYDGIVHESGNLRKARRYFEYAQVRFDGRTQVGEARKVETSITEDESAREASEAKARGARRYEIEAVRFYDHVQVRIRCGNQTTQSIAALPFSGRFSYLSLTGERCTLRDIAAERDPERIDETYIPRIAEEISYIKGCPEGDIPNLQVEGAMARTSAGIALARTTRLTFHARSLPNARLIWHCPYLVVYTSTDGTFRGESFSELVLVRLDGEELRGNVHTLGEDVTTLREDFCGWGAWVEGLHQGLDCEVKISYQDRRVTLSTENLGIAIHSVTEVPEAVEDVYVALTGDQCTMSDIHVERKD